MYSEFNLYHNTNRKKQLDKQGYEWGQLTPVSRGLQPFYFDPDKPYWGRCGICYNETNDTPCAPDDCYDRYQYYTCSKCPQIYGRKAIYVLCKNNYREYTKTGLYSSYPSDVCCTPYKAHLIEIDDVIEDVENPDNDIPQHVHAMFMDDQYKPYNNRHRWEMFKTTVDQKKYRTDTSGYNDGVLEFPRSLHEKAHYFVGRCSNGDCWSVRMGKIWK